MKCQVQGCKRKGIHEIGGVYICNFHEDRFYNYLHNRKKRLDNISKAVLEILDKNN